MSFNELPPKLTKEERHNLINCVGTDNCLHYCVAWADKCLCGGKIKKKCNSLQTTKWEYNCYECDCMVDGRYWGGGMNITKEEFEDLESEGLM